MKRTLLLLPLIALHGCMTMLTLDQQRVAFTNTPADISRCVVAGPVSGNGPLALKDMQIAADARGADTVLLTASRLVAQSGTAYRCSVKVGS